MNETTESSFVKLAKINVNEKVEKKGNLSYLSWPWAVDQLLRSDSKANWAYGTPDKYGDTLMVYCTVTAFGEPRTAQLPVMDHRNKAIANPDAFQVNTAMQRCLVKAIALHGLGLYIYAGEDLPEGEEGEGGVIRNGHQGPYLSRSAGNGPITPTSGVWESMDTDMQTWLTDIAHAVSTLLKRGDIKGAYDELESRDFDGREDVKVALWTRFDSKERSALKREGESRKPPKVAA